MVVYSFASTRQLPVFLQSVASACCFMCPFPIKQLSPWRFNFILLISTFFCTVMGHTLSLMSGTNSILYSTKQTFERKNFSTYTEDKLWDMILSFFFTKRISFKTFVPHKNAHEIQNGCQKSKRKHICHMRWMPLYRMSQYLMIVGEEYYKVIRRQMDEWYDRSRQFLIDDK